MNTGNFAGYIGRDAEVKSLDSGSTVCNFSVAVSTGWGDKKSTLWVSCAMWGDRGQKLAQFLTKGTPVSVSGDVDVRAYSAKDGTPKAEITCNVQRVTLQGRGSDAGEKDPPQSQAEQSKAKAPAEEFDSDVPFAFAHLAPLGGVLLLAGTLWQQVA